jgi:hypothetical protein
MIFYVLRSKKQQNPKSQVSRKFDFSFPQNKELKHPKCICFGNNYLLRKSIIKSWNIWRFLSTENISLSLHVRYAKAILFWKVWTNSPSAGQNFLNRPILNLPNSGRKICHFLKKSKVHKKGYNLMRKNRPIMAKIFLEFV